ncbi:MAG TPA: CocE/NonD family hydrolase, partial [Streptosporangiaceae bacterium]|nr:CocE/NonD family hydrolase [Streptosporangiaceae bacterium]
MRETGEVARAGPAAALPRHTRVLLRLSRRHLPAPRCGVAVERGVTVPAGDGVTLVTDHYVPLAEGPAPTLLVRSPYGRGFPWDYMYGALFAGQGFHVVIQSCRGTGGSGGEFEPFRDEAADARATVAWLRRQEWFNGALGTIGASYLGFTQWALATDPPPELRAMAVQVSSDDFPKIIYPGGAFALEAMLTGTAAMLSMDRGFGRFMLAMTRLLRQHRRVERTLPLIDAYPAAFGRRAAFFEEWLARPEPGDPYWAARRVVAPAERVPPAHLLGGWSDVCLDATLAQYRRLRAAGREVRLVVGPWNHTSGFDKDMPVVFGEALTWLRACLCDDRDHPPRQPVRIHVGEIGGPGEWRDLPDWPPPGTLSQPWHLHGDGTLAASPPARAAVSSLRYDPARPTPSVGG